MLEDSKNRINNRADNHEASSDHNFESTNNITESGRIPRSMSEKVALESKIDELEIKNAEMGAQITSFSEMLSQLQSQNDLLLSSNNDLKQRIESLSLENNSMRVQYERAVSAAAKYEAEVAQLKIACEELKKQVSGTDVNENKRKEMLLIIEVCIMEILNSSNLIVGQMRRRYCKC